MGKPMIISDEWEKRMLKGTSLALGSSAKVTFKVRSACWKRANQ